MSTRDQLGQIALLCALPSAALDELAAAACPRAYGDGQVLFLQGDRDVPVFCLLQGAVRVFHANPDGREQVLIHVEQGAMFNMPAAFVEDHGAPASATAVGPVQALLIPAAAFRRIVSQDPDTALAVLRDFALKLYHFTGLTYDLGLRSVRARLAHFLLSQVQSTRAAPVRWTHKEIAAQIGTVREVVSRTLRSFVRDGLIRLDRQRIVVVDRAALERKAE